MRISPIATRYGQAIFEIAVERDGVDSIGGDLAKFEGVLAAGSESRRLLVGPVYSLEARRRIVRALAERLGMGTVAGRFFDLLVEQGRIGLYGEIMAAFRRLVDEKAGRVAARVRAAAPLEEADRRRLREVLARLTGKEIELEVSVDPELIGGIVTEIGDKVYDGSLRSQIERLRQTLSNGSR